MWTLKYSKPSYLGVAELYHQVFPKQRFKYQGKETKVELMILEQKTDQQNGYIRYASTKCITLGISVFTNLRFDHSAQTNWPSHA
jgi:hypothetical protein